MENPENNTKTKPETTKIDGISAQINLSPGSETHRRFAELMREAGATTARSFIEMLMDNYQNPPQDTDSAKTIIELEKTVNNLKAEKASYEATLQNNETEIADLKAKLEEANKTANENAEKGLGQQLQLDEMKKRILGAIIIENPNPVAKYFLDEMAAKTKKEPGDILLKLFMDDLQNPRANHLPYDVPGSRVREVMAKLKQFQQQQQNTPDNGQQQQQ